MNESKIFLLRDITVEKTGSQMTEIPSVMSDENMPERGISQELDQVTTASAIDDAKKANALAERIKSGEISISSEKEKRRERVEYFKKCFSNGLNDPDIVAYHGCTLATVQYVIEHASLPGSTRNAHISSDEVRELSLFPIASKDIIYESRVGFNDDPALAGAEVYARENTVQQKFLEALGLDPFASYDISYSVHPGMDDVDIAERLKKNGHEINIKQVRMAIAGAYDNKNRGVIIGISKKAFVDYKHRQVAKEDDSEGEKGEEVITIPSGLDYRYIIGIEPMGECEYNFFLDL